MTKVKVFVYGRRRRQQQRHRRRRRGYDNSSPDFRHGELKIWKLYVNCKLLKLLHENQIVDGQTDRWIDKGDPYRAPA